MDKAEALAVVLEEYGVVVGRHGNVSCPLHVDATPSMSLERTQGLWRCHSCGKGGDVYTLIQEMQDVTFEEASSMLTITKPTGSSSELRAGGNTTMHIHDDVPTRLAPVQAGRIEHMETLLRAAEANLALSDQGLAYVASRGLSEATVKAFRLGLGTPEFGQGAGQLVIPYLGHDGMPLSMRTRCISCPGDVHNGHGKYMGSSGESTRLFNARAVVDNPTAMEVHVAEGEICGMSLTQCGLTAVAIPGANSIKPHYLTILRGFDTVYVWGDNDKAGYEFRDKLMGYISQARSVHIPDGDVNATLTARGPEGVLKLIGR